MEWKSYRIHAHDEVTRIGSGHRTVLARIGRKWVRVKSRVDPSRWAQRVHINIWNKIVTKELTND